VQLNRQAEALAACLLEPLRRRWEHVQAVAARASELARAVDDAERETLTAAAWLHDIGYAPAIAHTEFHPLDGARFLRDEGWPPEVVNLVAHHSGARYEAVERSLTDELAAFPFELNALQDALDAADLTTGPDGEPMTFAERMDEIAARYPPDDPVARFWPRARAVEAEAIERTMARLAAAQPR
jgi:putative nucleotidyltransferase with HDIG domain